MMRRSVFLSVFLAFLAAGMVTSCESPSAPRIPPPDDEDPEEQNPDPGESEAFRIDFAPVPVLPA